MSSVDRPMRRPVMRLLYLTAGAAEMYCGSCLRDNALAAALMARGHDVVLMPDLHADDHRRDQCQRRRMCSLAASACSCEQHVPLFRHTPALLDRLWDSTPVLKLASKRQIKVDPTALGEMTVSMLKGTAGHQRKEVEKMLRWLAARAALRCRHPAVRAAHRPRQAAREALARADRLHAAGRGSVSRAPAGAVAHAVAGADPARSRRRGRVHCRERVLRGLHVATTSAFRASQISVVPLGINLDGHGRSRRARTPPYTVGFFGRIAPEKGLHVLADAYRRLRAQAGRAGDAAARGRVPAQRTPAVLRRHRAADAASGASAPLPLRGRAGSRRQDRACSRRWT